MKLAKESGWSHACEERIVDLGKGKMLPQMRHGLTVEQQAKRDREYDSEIRRWRRRLFWARYGYIRAAIIGAAIGAIVGYHTGPFVLAFLR